MCDILWYGMLIYSAVMTFCLSVNDSNKRKERNGRLI